MRRAAASATSVALKKPVTAAKVSSAASSYVSVWGSSMPIRYIATRAVAPACCRLAITTIKAFLTASRSDHRSSRREPGGGGGGNITPAWTGGGGGGILILDAVSLLFLGYWLFDWGLEGLVSSLILAEEHSHDSKIMIRIIISYTTKASISHPTFSHHSTLCPSRT
jgi:hypothetical protein